MPQNIKLSITMPTKEVQEIELDIPIDKINDSEFIQSKFLAVGINLCRKLSDFGDKSFIELVNEFIPDQDGITDEFLHKWGLSKSQLNLKTKQTSTTVNTMPVDTAVVPEKVAADGGDVVKKVAKKVANKVAKKVAKKVKKKVAKKVVTKKAPTKKTVGESENVVTETDPDTVVIEPNPDTVVIDPESDAVVTTPKKKIKRKKRKKITVKKKPKT